MPADMTHRSTGCAPVRFAAVFTANSAVKVHVAGVMSARSAQAAPAGTSTVHPLATRNRLGSRPSSVAARPPYATRPQGARSAAASPRIGELWSTQHADPES